MYKTIKKLLLVLGIVIVPLISNAQFGDDTLQVSNLKATSTIRLKGQLLVGATPGDSAATKEYVDGLISGATGTVQLENKVEGQIAYTKSTGEDTLTTNSGFKFTTLTTPPAGYLFSGSKTISSVTDYFGFNGIFRSSIGIFGTSTYPICIGATTSTPAIYDIASTSLAGSAKVVAISAGINAWNTSYSSGTYPFRFYHTPTSTPGSASFTIHRYLTGSYTVTTPLLDIYDALSVTSNLSKVVTIRNISGTLFDTDTDTTRVYNHFKVKDNSTIDGDLLINGNITLIGNATGTFGVGGGTGGGDVYQAGAQTNKQVAVWDNDSTISGKSRLTVTSTSLGLGLNLQVLTSGAGNIAFGDLALNAVTTGAYNSAIGYYTLTANTGSYNTALGYACLRNNTTGAGNTAYGVNALRNNTTGGNNIAMGSSAIYTNTIGDNNVAIGNGGLYNATGSTNVAIGSSALYTLTTGSNNIGIGHYAGYNLTTQSNIIIFDNRLRTTDTIEAPIVAHTNTTTANQSITLNGNVFIKHALSIAGLSTFSSINFTDSLGLKGTYIKDWSTVGGVSQSSINGSLKPYYEGYTGLSRGSNAVDFQTIRSNVSQVASATCAVITGGSYNTSSGTFSIIGAGSYNTVSNSWSGILGGHTNVINTTYSFIGGGASNNIPSTSSYAAIAGGYGNWARSSYSFIGGGESNNIIGTYGSILGGSYNTSHDYGEAVVGVFSELSTGSSTVSASGNVLFKVGNGVSAVSLSDAFKVYQSGNAWVKEELEVGDTLRLPSIASGSSDRWLGITGSGAVFADTLINGGFMLCMKVPSIKEHLSDQKEGEISWYYENYKGEIIKTYSISHLRPSRAIQSLMAGEEMLFIYIDRLTDELEIEKTKNMELEERVSNLEKNFSKYMAK